MWGRVEGELARSQRRETRSIPDSMADSMDMAGETAREVEIGMRRSQESALEIVLLCWGSLSSVSVGASVRIAPSMSPTFRE